ncbi:MAG: GNAT family N-acetyltransferase, partial [Candidatus Thorarchaeota archaeon]|jgi:N-acetylglutamate synthase-like GNAT family acetyltransferase
MVKIRRGTMKDCKDLLEVYMGTRWSERISTVEQVKNEHRGVAFEKWGWLVATFRGKVVGEILFRVERNPVAGKLGIIRSLGVDVRYQKRDIGTKLTRAAERAMKEKKVGRIVATTPPEAYNYWMKVDYHKRYWVMRIQAKPSKIPVKKSTKVKSVTVSPSSGLPRSMRFSNLAYPGELAEVVREIVTNKKPGILQEHYSDDRLVGVGAVVLEGKAARFVADVTVKGEEHAGLIVCRTAKAASKLRAQTVFTLVPQDRLSWYLTLNKWKSEMHRDFPVTKLA